tara:strand:- start:179 stop:658 length:480 start_codon:yes stop_codon:yes gene_type:complete
MYPELVNQLFVVDIAPVEYSREDVEIVDFLLNTNIENCKSRNEADFELSKYINDKELRSFLLQNLNFKNGTYVWSLNLNAIKMGMKDLRGFPLDSISNTSEVKTICIFGAKSSYVNEKYKKQFETIFLNLKFIKIDGAGHWLHAEKPSEFIEIISKNLI